MNTLNEIRPLDKAARLQAMVKDDTQAFLDKICSSILVAHSKGILPHGPWTKEFNAGITTYTYTGTDEEKISGAVGTNKQIVVKIKKKGTPDGLKTEYFFQRGQSIVDGMNHYLKHTFPGKDFSKIDILISHYLHNYKIQIDKECRLDPDELYESQTLYSRCEEEIKLLYLERLNLIKLNQMKERLKTISDKRSAYGARIVAIALKHQQELVASLSQLLFNFHAEQDIQLENVEAAVKALQLAEKMHIKATGRPHIIKLTEWENGIWRLSAQLTQGLVTVPSSIRRISIIPANFVLHCDGHVIRGKTILSDVNNRHSSLPPIELSDNEILCRYNTYLAAEYVIRNAAKNILKANENLKIFPPTLGNIDDPIEINIATALLLTPLRNKHAEEKIRSNESEHGQLNNTRWAIKMLLHGRKNENGLLVFKINKRNIYVKLKYEIINTPVNVMDLTRKASKSPLEKNINAEGFYYYFKRVDKFIKDLNVKLTENATDIIARLKEVDNSQANYGPESMPEFTEERYKELQDLHKKLLEVFILETAKENRKGTFSKNIKKIKNNIRKIQNEAYGFLKNKYKQIKTDYSKNKAKIDYILALIKKELTEIHKTNERTEQINNTREFLKIIQLHLILTKTLFGKNRISSKYLYVIPALYMKTTQALGWLVSGNCKSCEDRGGLLRVFLMALDNFFDTYGYFPDPDDDFDWTVFQTVYRAPAEDESTSHQNTGFNAVGSAGLQVLGEKRGVFNRSEDDANARTAKMAYKNLPKNIAIVDVDTTNAPNVVIAIPDSRDKRRYKTIVTASIITATVGISLLVLLGILAWQLGPNTLTLPNSENLMYIALITLPFALVVANMAYQKYQQQKNEFLSRIYKDSFLNTEGLFIVENNNFSINNERSRILVENLINYHHEQSFRRFISHGYLTFNGIQKLIDHVYYQIPTEIFIGFVEFVLKAVLNPASVTNSEYYQSQTYVAQYIITASMLRLIGDNKKNDAWVALLLQIILKNLHACIGFPAYNQSILANACNHFIKSPEGFWGIFKKGTTLIRFLQQENRFTSIIEKTAAAILHSANTPQIIIDQLNMLGRIDPLVKSMINQAILKEGNLEWRERLMAVFGINEATNGEKQPLLASV